ncbi:hypothetical protein ALC56_10885 [Trachymyrmex septentrionalis]|uniref:Uncharacterized protein n=1 Tax=Trachymyrmex septentrionalis TaxID=34720 RepID=A0A195F421_9HYME|nr:hypothetical protein ALC56_10885 [Trachymyrmex septentrionalis]
MYDARYSRLGEGMAAPRWSPAPRRGRKRGAACGGGKKQTLSRARPAADGMDVANYTVCLNILYATCLGYQIIHIPTIRRAEAVPPMEGEEHARYSACVRACTTVAITSNDHQLGPFGNLLLVSHSGLVTRGSRVPLLSNEGGPLAIPLMPCRPGTIRQRPCLRGILLVVGEPSSLGDARCHCRRDASTRSVARCKTASSFLDSSCLPRSIAHSLVRSLAPNTTLVCRVRVSLDHLESSQIRSAARATFCLPLSHTRDYGYEVAPRIVSRRWWRRRRRRRRRWRTGGKRAGGKNVYIAYTRYVSPPRFTARRSETDSRPSRGDRQRLRDSAAVTLESQLSPGRRVGAAWRASEGRWLISRMTIRDRIRTREADNRALLPRQRVAVADRHRLFRVSRVSASRRIVCRTRAIDRSPISSVLRT